LPSFAVSICFLSLVQAVLVAVARAFPPGILMRLRSRWWAILPPASIVVVIAAISADAGSADALTYLALVTVPPAAALALARLVPGAKSPLALAVVPLFVAAWIWAGAVGGELAGLALTALACIALGGALTTLVTPRWLTLGVYAMAVVDTCLVASDLLQGPNNILNEASPAAGLPRLQTAQFGSAVMGFGDLFIAATVGMLLATRRRSQVIAALLVAALGLAFNLLFLVVNELPTTVPVALALAIVEALDRHRQRRRVAPASPELRAQLLSGAS
jgi:hypothetical protein